MPGRVCRCEPCRVRDAAIGLDRIDASPECEPGLADRLD
jgi:hypothetical protein